MSVTNNRTIFSPAAGITVVSLLLSSCGFFGGDERPVYQGAEYYKNLEVPPELTAPDTTDELKIPTPSEGAQQQFRDNNKLETVITPEFDGVRMVNYAGNSWLEVDNDVEYVWPRLLDFWQREGVELVQVRPSLGFVETEWTERLSADASFFKSLFQRLEPDQKDKFRTRVERFDDGKKTRIYITHAKIERIVSGEDSDEFIWVSQPSDLETEREVISRMALYAGLNKEQSTALLANYRAYSPLVKKESSNTTALTMKGSMDFVWHRAMRALDRMEMQDIRQEPANNTIFFTVGKVSDKELEIEEDKLSKSSWLMQLFTDVDETNIASDKSRKYRLKFTELEQEARISIEVKDVKGTQTIDEEGDTSGTALAEQLRNLLADRLE